MREDISASSNEAVSRTGVNDHSWEREHRHPVPDQARAIGQRRRDAEAKLEQHLMLALRKAT